MRKRRTFTEVDEEGTSNAGPPHQDGAEHSIQRHGTTALSIAAARPAALSGGLVMPKVVIFSKNMPMEAAAETVEMETGKAAQIADL